VSRPDLSKPAPDRRQQFAWVGVAFCSDPKPTRTIYYTLNSDFRVVSSMCRAVSREMDFLLMLLCYEPLLSREKFSSRLPACLANCASSLFTYQDIVTAIRAPDHRICAPDPVAIGDPFQRRNFFDGLLWESWPQTFPSYWCGTRMGKALTHVVF
jgi:hypothetical protein